MYISLSLYIYIYICINSGRASLEIWGLDPSRRSRRVKVPRTKGLDAEDSLPARALTAASRGAGRPDRQRPRTQFSSNNNVCYLLLVFLPLPFLYIEIAA